MANARPDRPTSFEGGATEGEEDDDNNVDKHSPKDESLTSNNKQNGVPPVRNVDRYGFMGGDQYTSPEEIPKVTLDIIRKREVKWMEMFENWEKWMTKRFKRVRARCRKGIPPSLRARAWQYLCGSKFLMDQNQGKFEEYLHKAGDPKWIEDIHKDLHRQFPLHEIFALRGGHGQEDLFRILKAYTIHNPQDGYCQAQGPIAAVLLMHMPAEQAFWCLVSICEKYLPGYYSPGLEAVHIDGDVLFGLLKKSSPLIYKHLKKQKIEPILYMTEWFMCIFSRTLPWTAVLRVWDMFFCEGVKVMFRIALVLFKLTLGTPEKLSECPTLYETMEKLRHIPHELIDGEFISKESLKLNVDEKDMEKEHQYQITKRRNQREKAQSSAKTETKGPKQKRKEKRLENEQENKKHNTNSHLTFWKAQNKLWTHKENVLRTTVPKPTEDERNLQPPSSVSKSESESPKKLQPSMISKMQKMEMAKMLAEEAFTAKVQQTLQPDVQLSAEVDQFVSVTPKESSSKENLQQTSQSVQLMTQTSSSDLSSIQSESVSSETKVQCISLDQLATAEKPLLESSLSTEENQSEESKRYSADGNQLQRPVSVLEQEVKSQLHFADNRTTTVVQRTHSYHKMEDKAEIHQVDLAAKLEPGQLLTYPPSQIQTKSKCPNSSQLLIQKAENEQHFSSDNQLISSGFIASEAPSPVEMQKLDMYKSRSQNSSPSRDLICESVHDPVCLDKIQYLSNLSATDPAESQVSDASEGVSSSVEVAELESLFMNPLLIESNEMGWKPVEQIVVDEILSDINYLENQQVEFSEDQMPPNKEQAAEIISGTLQQVSPVTMEDVSDEMQSQQQSSVDKQSMLTKQTELANTHIVLEPNNLTDDNEIETSRLVHENQKITVEPLIVKSQQVRPKHCLAASQQMESSLSTETVKSKPVTLSSTFEMEISSISPESKKLPSTTIVIKKQSVSPVKQLAVESLLVKTQRPLQLAELSLSTIEASSKEQSPLNSVLPQENPRSEANRSDSIENQCFTLEEDPNAVTDNLVGENETENIQESDNIDQTNVTEQLVQHLSWQTVQHSNKDDTLIPVETEANLSPKYDSTQMKETHV